MTGSVIENGKFLPSQDLGDAPIGDLEDPGDVTGSGSGVSELDDFLSGGVRQGTPADEHPP